MGTQEPNPAAQQQAEVDWGATDTAPIIEAAGQPPVPVDALPETPPSAAQQLQRQADLDAIAHNEAARQAAHASEQGATMPTPAVMGGGISPEPPPIPMSPEDAATAESDRAAAAAGAMVLPDTAVVPLSHEDPGLVAAMGAHERLDALDAKITGLIPTFQDASHGKMIDPLDVPWTEPKVAQVSPEEQARYDARQKRNEDLEIARCAAATKILDDLMAETLDPSVTAQLAQAFKDLGGSGIYF